MANLKEIFAAAQKSQRSGKDAHAGFLQPHRDPTADADIGFCEEDVGRWMDSQQDLNAEQRTFLETIAKQMLHENAQPTTMQAPDTAGPIRWLLHGKPGAGKSHTIKKLQQLFEEVAGYQQDVHFQIVALQATMAVQISGDTIHHALHIRKGDRHSASATGVTADGKLAQRMLLWR